MPRQQQRSQGKFEEKGTHRIFFVLVLLAGPAPLPPPCGDWRCGDEPPYEAEGPLGDAVLGRCGEPLSLGAEGEGEPGGETVGPWPLGVVGADPFGVLVLELLLPRGDSLLPLPRGDALLPLPRGVVAVESGGLGEALRTGSSTTATGATAAGGLGSSTTAGSGLASTTTGAGSGFTSTTAATGFTSGMGGAGVSGPVAMVESRSSLRCFVTFLVIAHVSLQQSE